MKKSFTLIFSLLIIIFYVTGCNNGKQLNIGGKSDVLDNINNGVVLEIKDGTLSNMGTKIELTNNSEKILRYGPDYFIEINENNEWHVINVHSVFHTILYSLHKGESVEYKIDWETNYGELPKGKYRLIKYFYFEDENKNKSDDFTVSVEFEI